MYREYADQCKPHECTLEESFELDDGDLLYIPIKKYHRVDTLSPRISISFHFREFDGKPYIRKEWYDWKPEEIYNGR